MVSVLYVDDDDTIRRAVQAWLDRHQAAGFTAATIYDARRELDARAFDGVFIDIWLPDGTGFDLYAWIQEHHPRLADRVVFITGDIKSGEPTEKQLHALGRRVLGKPFDLRELEQYLQLWSAPLTRGA
jgi:DNA-binding response OmpR family regulator